MDEPNFTPNKGHYCYGCESHFRDTNPNVKSHKGCKGKKSFGICVDRREFGEYDPMNIKRLSLVEIINIKSRLQGKKEQTITDIKNDLIDEIQELVKEK